MFTKELSAKLLKLIDERDMTIETLAEVSNLSRKFMGNIISQKQSPSVNTLEKICSALEVTPNDLLISDKSMLPDKSNAMSVTKVYCYDNIESTTVFPVCPNCNVTFEREYQSYCDRCGQRLSWNKYSKAEIIYVSEISNKKSNKPIKPKKTSNNIILSIK